MTTLSHLECSLCSKRHEACQLQNLCECGGPLLARYDLETARRNWNREWLLRAPATMWRYAPVLPVSKPEKIVSLGEGFTPLLRARRLGAVLGATDLWIKDEANNPTGSFKARGLSCAVSMAAELGATSVALPSAGNAAGALASYAAAAGLKAHVFLPSDVPAANYMECRAAGAEVTLVQGLISDCGKLMAERGKTQNWFDIGTLREPYRIEGKKTMGYELAEQFQWTLPSAILYPAGGGVGLIGMWKAFAEMETLGWIGPQRPKMIAVQAAGCQPVVRAYESGLERAEMWPDASTIASGLRVPKPLGDHLMLAAIRASNGCSIAVTDQEMLDAGVTLASSEGLFAAPEGAACVAAAGKLFASGFLGLEEKIVLFNTGTGFKYLEAYGTRFRKPGAWAFDRLGGLITPR